LGSFMRCNDWRLDLFAGSEREEPFPQED